MSKKVTKVDITPTWWEITPALVQLLENATTVEDRELALAELSRMAQLADERVEQLGWEVVG